VRPAAGAPSEYSSSFAGGRLLHFNGDAQPPRGIIMKLPRRKFLHLAACAAALPVVSRIARAQSYPTRPITFNVPFPAGGPTDAIARVTGERMRVALGQPILIENVSGAAGSIGVGRVAHASPDGYTVGVGHWSTHVVNGAIYDLSYDLLKDFAPVALLPANPQLIVSKERAGGKSQGTHRLAKGERIQGCGGHRGCGLCLTDRRDLFSKDHRHALYHGPIPRHWPGLE
jgi:hypothetical protein